MIIVCFLSFQWALNVVLDTAAVKTMSNKVQRRGSIDLTKIYKLAAISHKQQMQNPVRRACWSTKHCALTEHTVSTKHARAHTNTH